MNVITVSGNVGNAELKKFGTNDLLKFSLAVKKKYSKDGQNDTQWFNCNLWGSRAEKLQQYITKGAGLVVSGEMDLNYDKDQKKGFPQINVDTLDIMKWANDSGQQQTNQQPQQQSQQKPPQQKSDQQNYNQQQQGFQALDGLDDVPF